MFVRTARTKGDRILFSVTTVGLGVVRPGIGTGADIMEGIVADAVRADTGGGLGVVARVCTDCGRTGGLAIVGHSNMLLHEYSLVLFDNLCHK